MNMNTMLPVAALALLDVLLPFPKMPRFVIAAAGALALGVFLFQRIRETRRRHRVQSAARAMESARPELGRSIRTALEITRRGIARDATEEEKWFAQRLVAQSEDALHKFSWRSPIPRARWAA